MNTKRKKMPSYTIIHKVTKKKTKNVMMTIAEMEEYLVMHPEHDILPGTPLIHSGFMSGESKSDSWNDLLKQIKKRNPRSTVKLRK